MEGFIQIESSLPLEGRVGLWGAKNAVLVILVSLLLPRGKSTLTNVPFSADVVYMVELLRLLGARVDLYPDEHRIDVHSESVSSYYVPNNLMHKMRASILVLGPLLARFGQANVGMPGGDAIGARPIDLHMKNFSRMGVQIVTEHDRYIAHCKQGGLKSATLILDYPSVGATENLLLAAVLTPGKTRIVNAALEPEVTDLIEVLRKMGADIKLICPNNILIEGVEELYPVEHHIIPDRLEAGTLLLAAAVTKGAIFVDGAMPETLEIFLYKLENMGHKIIASSEGIGIQATDAPCAVSIKTGPYPSFPTDLQALMMVLQCLANGESVIEEAVHENRFHHVSQLQLMGANIAVNNQKARIKGVQALVGTSVTAHDLRASCALVLAGLVAQGRTRVYGIEHWFRGHEHLELKLNQLGARVQVMANEDMLYSDTKVESFTDCSSFPRSTL